MLPPINFKAWIDEHRHLLKPPVGNQVVYENTDFIVMVVGGPNSRKDFHINQGEEFFYQLEGNITLKTVQDGKVKDVHIKEGEIFLLPPNVPHSPQRPANTVGLVIERKRDEGEKDVCVWFCESCESELYRTTFNMKDIVVELKDIMEDYYSSDEKRTCGSCGAVMEPPVPVG